MIFELLGENNKTQRSLMVSVGEVKIISPLLAETLVMKDRLTRGKQVY